MRTVDLNADLGELPSLAAADRALMAWVSSANVACGGHAGDDASMEATVRAALAANVAIGAHPSYPDREGFGRRRVDLPDEALEASVASQVSALAAVARRLGARLAHVKPHGALYNDAAREPATARAVARGVARVLPGAVLVGLAGSGMLGVFRDEGFFVAAEAFADRLYEPDGSLTPRSVPGSLLVDPREVAERALGIARDGLVTARDGTVLSLAADTLCLHGDTPGAEALARAVVETLGAAGIEIRPVTRGRSNPPSSSPPPPAGRTAA